MIIISRYVIFDIFIQTRSSIRLTVVYQIRTLNSQFFVSFASTKLLGNITQFFGLQLDQCYEVKLQALYTSVLRQDFYKFSNFLDLTLDHYGLQAVMMIQVDVCRRANNIGILMLCMYRFPILIVVSLLYSIKTAPAPDWFSAPFHSFSSTNSRNEACIAFDVFEKPA